MIKTFCDVCETEITKANAAVGGYNSDERLGAELKTDKGVLRCEVITSWDNTANAGQFCRYCIVAALKKLDDRPRPAARGFACDHDVLDLIKLMDRQRRIDELSPAARNLEQREIDQELSALSPRLSAPAHA